MAIPGFEVADKLLGAVGLDDGYASIEETAVNVIKFHHVGTHADDGFDCRDGVLRIVAPITSVARDNYIFRCWVVDLCRDHFSAICVLRLCGASGASERTGSRNLPYLILPV